MQRHFLVVKSFVGALGFEIHEGEIGIPGDMASTEVRAEIEKQVAAGNLEVMGEGYRPKGWSEKRGRVA